MFSKAFGVRELKNKTYQTALRDVLKNIHRSDENMNGMFMQHTDVNRTFHKSLIQDENNDDYNAEHI